jgi:hypothetical protein
MVEAIPGKKRRFPALKASTETEYLRIMIWKSSKSKPLQL